MYVTKGLNRSKRIEKDREVKVKNSSYLFLFSLLFDAAFLRHYLKLNKNNFIKIYLLKYLFTLIVIHSGLFTWISCEST